MNNINHFVTGLFWASATWNVLSIKCTICKWILSAKCAQVFDNNNNNDDPMTHIWFTECNVTLSVNKEGSVYYKISDWWAYSNPGVTLEVYVCRTKTMRHDEGAKNRWPTECEILGSIPTEATNVDHTCFYFFSHKNFNIRFVFFTSLFYLVEM